MFKRGAHEAIATNLVGYIVGAYKIKINEPAPMLKITVKPNALRLDSKEIVGCYRWLYIGDPRFGYKQLIPFKPSMSHPANVVSAIVHRVGCAMPTPQPAPAALFADFARRFITRAFKPVRPEDYPEIDDWLDGHSYSGSRKAELRRLYDELRVFRAKVTEVKSFIKDEEYDEPKNARSINSSSDVSKSLLGAIIHAVDHATFQTKWFVKGTNPRTWAAKMRDIFGNRPVVGTDFSSFEAHHSGVYAEVIYFWMMHMTRLVAAKPGMRMLRRLIHRMTLGINCMKFKTVFAELLQRLMSGNLWTSSANGVLNLLLNSFMAAVTANPNATVDELVQWALDQFVGLVEGDDGIFLDYGVTQQTIDSLGLKLKWERAQSYDRIGFCQVYCDPVVHVTLKNPISVLRKFDILPKEFENANKNKCLAYLRAKAICYLVSYCDAPVVGELAYAICRLTRSIDPRTARAALDRYHSEWFDLGMREKVWARKPMVADSSRAVVSQRWGLTVEEQLHMESVFQRQSVVGVIPLDLSMYLNRATLAHHRYLIRAGEVPPRFHDPLPPDIDAIMRRGKPCQFGAARAINVAFTNSPPRLDKPVRADPNGHRC